MKRNQQRRGYSAATWLCIVLIVVVITMIVGGCAAVGYVGGAASAVRSELEMNALQERVRALEEGDIWTR